ncbi:hypothetical protein [Algibacter mikhailovii]|uniref:hypothetical protein n=1 Tax=Algibacter mikhailovii TaxID=425498 RepID=UPI002494E509|nr:hypothetical protein [Algibacter mikhailovii]
MKTKKEIIDYINATKSESLNSSNASYSKINKSKDVWWFNVRTDKFNSDVHLLLNTVRKVIWIKLPKGSMSNLYNTFKVREDKDAVDLEISADRNFNYLQDVKSGGTGFDFSGFVKEIIEF